MQDLIIVAGSVASRYANGGHPWELFSWATGLRRLGFDVCVVDQLFRDRCVYPEGAEPGYRSCLNVPYARTIADGFGFEDSYAIVGDDGRAVLGPSLEDLLDLAGDSAMLVNLSGTLSLEQLKQRCRLKVYVDCDPGLTQLWLASGNPAPRVEGHDLHFTIGENVGTSGCALPTAGISWLHVRQPVVLDDWPVVEGRARDRFTTLATLRGPGPHGPLEQIDHDPGHKADELRKIAMLPQLASATFELAVRMSVANGHDVELLERNCWNVVDAAAVAGDAATFRGYVQASGAEFSVAKGVFAETRCGWFSDRTTRYLASGKPALVQDTGFAPTIPVGEGLFAFRTVEDAVAAVEQIADDYDRHSRAARALAAEYFDSDLVLSRFLESIDLGR
jgi:hypothetical protein